MATAGVSAAWGIRATPFPVTVTQPDGTKLTLVIKGDERGAVMLTTDGYAVVQNPATKRYEYAEVTLSGLQSLGIAASNPDSRDASVASLLERVDKAGASEYLERARSRSVIARKSPQRVKISNYPTLGHQKALVILVAFSDTEFTTVSDPHAYYHNMLNQEGFVWDNGANGSARDFYIASSDGRFDPEFTVVGPVVLENPASYYGGDRETLDANAADMITEASIAADSLIDYSEYDADGDGYVDNIYFFYAGFSQADSGYTDAIWPHSGTLEESWGRELVLDGIRLNRYACSNEIRGGSGPDFKPVGIGTFVHEFGHVLGIADHYDTAYSSGRTGVNQWDTMAAASYFNNQNTPPLFNAFERAELGWLEYTELSPKEEGWLDLLPLDEENKAYRVAVEGTEGREYFVIENRRRQGWDTYLPGEGMLVWHVDMDEEKWWNNTINNDPVHQCFDLVEADGKENADTCAADPFPGRKNVTEFVFTGWDSREAFSFDNLGIAESHVRFLLGNTGFVPESPAVEVRRTGGVSVEFSFLPVKDAQYYLVSLLDAQGNAVADYDNLRLEEPAEMLIEGLTPFSEYTLEVKAGTGSYLSNPTECEISTSDICLFERIPELSSPENVTASGFTVGWSPLAGAEDYSVSIDEKSYGEPESSVCDFTDWPDAWSSTSSKLNKAMYGNKSPSLQLSNDGDYVEFISGGDRIETLTFWVGSQSGSNSMTVEYFDETTGDCIVLAEEKLTAGCREVSFTLPETAEATAVRVTFRKGSGYMVVDDMECGYSPVTWMPAGQYTGVLTGGASTFTATGLYAERDYRVSIAGIAGIESSRTATMIVRTGKDSGVDTLGAEETPTIIESYDLTGMKVSQGYRGIVIERYSNGSVRKRVR